MQKFARINVIGALLGTISPCRFYSKPSISENSTHYNFDQVHKVVIEGNLPDAALDPSLFYKGSRASIRKTRWKKLEPQIALKSFLKNHLQLGKSKLQSDSKIIFEFLDRFPREQQ